MRDTPSYDGKQGNIAAVTAATPASTPRPDHTTGHPLEPGSPPTPSPIPLGTSGAFAKTVTEADVGLFAGLTGDFAPHHVNAQHMRDHPLGGRVAHGVLVLGIASSAATDLCERAGATALSYGYDRLRFVQPVRLGDTVSARYEATAWDPARQIVTAVVTATNQHGATVLAANHLLYCYPEES